MSNELLRLLGLDPNSPEAKAAREDDNEVATLMRCLYEVRRRSGLTQAEVAERMKTTQSAVSDLERTAVDPHVSTLQRYARAVGAALRLRIVAANDDWKPVVRIHTRSHRTQHEHPHGQPRLVTWTLSKESESRGA